jgi:class 3 adenylate cyclase
MFQLQESVEQRSSKPQWVSAADLAAARENARVTISEERRLVTVLFVDMVGFTGRTETSDPEDVREIQRAYFETVAAEIERYAGTVEKYIGDAVMAIFGAPRAHGDDPERALRAALGIRDAFGRGQVELEIRIGVDTGEVVGGGAPGAHAAEYTVTGDAVNVAARLQQVTEPGEIVVGASTQRLAAEAFDSRRCFHWSSGARPRRSRRGASCERCPSGRACGASRRRSSAAGESWHCWRRRSTRRRKDTASW